ncbi:histidine kinase [Ruminococcus sp.]|uniref:histidine kinase n=1 Tax=Ruminococcus sp. TaxID=41978 RepID=UPI00388D7DF8
MKIHTLVHRKRNIIPLLIIGLVFPIFIIMSGILLNVETTNITAFMRMEAQQGDTAIYSVSPQAFRDQPNTELMFEAKGNIIKVVAENEILYEYGQESVEKNEMIGTVYVHTYIPSHAAQSTIHIYLTAVDSNADPAIDKLELCPHDRSIHYYLTNKNLGLPIALVLLATAFCIPIFLFLTDEIKLMYEGIVFGCVLICLSIMLLNTGGHYLVFTSGQRQWNYISYTAARLFPSFFLLYFSILETQKPQKRILYLATGLNFLFCIVTFVLAVTHTVKYCDTGFLFNILLLFDTAIGTYMLYGNLKEKRLSHIRLIILNLAIIWAGIVVLFLPIASKIEAKDPIHGFDILSVGAVIIFYLMSGLYIESALDIRARSYQSSKRIEELEKTEQNVITIDGLMQALSARYESIYLINPVTGSYTCYHESESHGELGVEASGDDFYAAMDEKVPLRIHPDDVDYFREMIAEENILNNTENGESYSFVYRICTDSDETVYHKIRATRRMIGDTAQLLLGIRDIDAMMKREKAHEDIQQSMLLKERNHMQAILASAAGYMEINLTKDTILDQKNRYDKEYNFPDRTEAETNYSKFIEWLAQNVILDHKEKFLETNNRLNLIQNFAKGILRASVSFNSVNTSGLVQPCRQVIYLYKDTTSDDIMCFNVTYDLTEQQKAEKEMKQLKEKLQMSRLRVFTGQMQPHFLYNALGSIQEVILENPVYASELVGNFSVHLRASIRAMASDYPIPFEQELQNIKAYVEIEKMRFGDKLKVAYDIRAKDFLISPLSIQPLVENSIRHGIYERGKQGGTVTVTSTETDEHWIVSVKDDGVGFDRDKMFESMKSGSSNSSGLKNLIFRLNKVMNAYVDVKSKINEGTEITVTIPKGEDTNESNYRR